MKDLEIYFPVIRLQNNFEDPDVDDISLIPLIDNCKQLKRIVFKFRVDSIIDSIIKWTEVISDSTKRSITFQTYLSNDLMERVLSHMSRLEKIENLEVNYNNIEWIPSHWEVIKVMFDKQMTISVFITTKSYFNQRTDVWQTLCRYKGLQRLEFRVPFEDLDESMRNIEPLIKLREIVFECEIINKHFFDNITKLAPNVKELEFTLLKPFKLTNDTLITLSQLKCLTRICLVSTEKKYHSVDDIGVIQLLDNCQKLREVILDLEVNITSVSIDKLKKVANRAIESERPKNL